MGFKQSHFVALLILLPVSLVTNVYAEQQDIDDSNYCQNQRTLKSQDNNLRRQLDTDNPLPQAAEGSKIIIKNLSSSMYLIPSLKKKITFYFALPIVLT